MKVTVVRNNFQGNENFLIGGQRVCLSICLKHVSLFEYTFKFQNGLLEQKWWYIGLLALTVFKHLICYWRHLLLTSNSCLQWDDYFQVE